MPASAQVARPNGGAVGIDPMKINNPTDHLDKVVHFYKDGLGLEIIASFDDHDGFDGVMLGKKGAPYHLEFTHKRGHETARAPGPDNLLVFYLPDKTEWQQAVDRMRNAGYDPVPSFNPYWDHTGKTFEDIDGYRVVIQNTEWR